MGNKGDGYKQQYTLLHRHLLTQADEPSEEVSWMIVRWLGAFCGRNHSLAESLAWELTQQDREVAAQPLGPQTTPLVCRWGVGLRVAEGATVRVFRHDCYSEVENFPRKGQLARLVPTRVKFKPSHAEHHGEAICKPHYDAIVIQGRLDGDVYKVVLALASQFNLRVVRIEEGRYPAM